MLIIAVALFAIVSIFSQSNIQTYYTTLFSDTKVSTIKALSVYSAVENIAMALGPVVFSYILANNNSAGMKLFAANELGCLLAFIPLSAGILRSRK
jgi:predicted MFS family arabinose efflux permease